MTAIQLFWLILACCWLVVEIRIIWIGRREKSILKQEGKTEANIWLVIALSLPLALGFKELHLWTLPGNGIFRQSMAVILYVGGLTLRFYAANYLGKFFTTRVSIQTAHQLIRTGPYRYIRHPSYCGLMLAFAGASIAMGDMLAMAVLLIPLGYVLHKRIEVEEHWLHEHFGREYALYCGETKKLVPSLY